MAAPYGIPIPRSASRHSVSLVREQELYDDSEVVHNKDGSFTSQRRSSSIGRRASMDGDGGGRGMRHSSSVVGVDEEGNEKVWYSSLPRFLTCGGGLLPHGSIASSGFNLASATLGAGVLALPQAMGRSGVLLGSVMLLLCFVATVFSMRLLIMVVEKTQQRTYEEISEHLFGKRGKIFTATTIILFCFGVTVMYVIMIADVLEIVSEQVKSWPTALSGEHGRQLMIFLYWVVFMMPLSLMREINSLRYASLVGMASTAFLVISMFVDASRLGNLGRLPLARFDLKALMALPTFTFCFCCQTNAFEIYAELKNPTIHRMTFTSAVSMYACTALYLVAAVSGVAEFGTHAESNVLKSYTDVVDKPYILIAMIAVTFTLTMAFPICVFPMRDALLQALGFEDVFDAPSRWRIGVSFGLAAASLIGGLFITSIGSLLGVLGGVCGGLVAYILPTVFAHKSGVLTEAGTGHVIAGYAMLVAGVLFGIMATVLTALQLAGVDI
jgi:amino acid permease